MPARVSKDDAFLRWWNANYLFVTGDSFHTSLHALYKKLYDLGADLDYVDFLCRMLKRGIKPKKIKRRKHRSTASNAFISFRKGGFSLQGLLDQASETEEQSKLWEKDKVKRDRVYQAFPILSVFSEYHPLRVGKGRKSHSWETFFLLAVTTHLCKKSKRKKPNFLIAQKLLRLLTGKNQSKPNYKLRTSAVDMVSKLKQSHPRWQTSLKATEDAFRLDKKGFLQFDSIFEFFQLSQTLDFYYKAFSAGKQDTGKR